MYGKGVQDILLSPSHLLSTCNTAVYSLSPKEQGSCFQQQGVMDWCSGCDRLLLAAVSYVFVLNSPRRCAGFISCPLRKQGKHHMGNKEYGSWAHQNTTSALQFVPCLLLQVCGKGGK